MNSEINLSTAKIPGGYLLLSRKLIDSEIYKKPPLFLKIWIYLLQNAQHRNYKQLKRGQLWTNLNEIREACSWYVGYRKEYLSKSKINDALEWMRGSSESEDEGCTKLPMITTTKTTHGQLITINNYDLYQDPANYESNSEGNSENSTKTIRKEQSSDNINKNVKNVNNKIYNISQKNKFSEDSIEIILSKELFEAILNNNSEAKKPNFQSWAKHVELMLTIDKRTEEGIRKVILFSQNHQFWKGIILSTSKLREKFDQLTVQSKSISQTVTDPWRDINVN